MKWASPFVFLVVTTLPSFVYHLFTTHFCASLVTESYESEELFDLGPCARVSEYARAYRSVNDFIHMPRVISGEYETRIDHT